MQIARQREENGWCGEGSKGLLYDRFLRRNKFFIDVFDHIASHDGIESCTISYLLGERQTLISLLEVLLGVRPNLRDRARGNIQPHDDVPILAVHFDAP